MNQTEEKFTFKGGDDINDKARKLARDYWPAPFSEDVTIKLEMDFVAFAYNYNQSRLSAILTKIEELPESLYLEYGWANMSMMKSAVKSLIEEELER